MLGHPDVFRLFTHRFSKTASQVDLAAELESMIAGTHPLVEAIEQPMRTLIQNQLGMFHAARPIDFDLRGASIGNLILAGGYLNQNQQLEPIIFLVAKLVGVQAPSGPLPTTTCTWGQTLRMARLSSASIF